MIIVNGTGNCILGISFNCNPASTVWETLKQNTKPPPTKGGVTFLEVEKFTIPKLNKFDGEAGIWLTFNQHPGKSQAFNLSHEQRLM